MKHYMMVALAASLTMEKGDSYNAIAESYVDSEKGITDKQQWGSTLLGEETYLPILTLHFYERDNKTIYFRFYVKK